jgi:hypothetical protein
MASPRIDWTHFPIVSFTYLSDMRLEDVDGLITGLEQTIARGRFLAFIDLNAVGEFDARTRIAIAKRVNDLERKHPGACLAEAGFAKSRLQRGIFTAYNWIREGNTPRKTFDSEDEARRWLISHRDRLTHEGRLSA